MNPAAGPAFASEPAPAEVLRTVAHDLCQPLSSIETIAYYLTLVLPHADEKVRTQLEQIRQLVEQANRILSHGIILVSDAEIANEAKHPLRRETDTGGHVQKSLVPQPLGINAA